MSWRWTISAVFLLAALPAVLYGSRLKDEVYLQTVSVGKVEFLSLIHISEPTRLVHSSRMPSSA